MTERQLPSAPVQPGAWLKKAWIVRAFVEARYLRRFGDREALEAWQESRIQRHIADVSRSAPWIAERFPDPRRWRETPAIDKGQMMARFGEANTQGIGLDEALEVALAAERSRDFRPTVRGTTVGLSSGTSGHRGVFLASPAEEAFWAGSVLGRMLRSPLWRRRRIAFFLRSNSNLYESLGSVALSFSFFDLVQPFEAHVEGLRRFGPTTIVAPPSLLRALALVPGLAGELGPEQIIAVAEVLEKDDRRLIESAFGLRVDEVYQATEGFLASTCAHGALHLAEDAAIIEAEWLDERRFVPVISDLWRTTQPILRYRLNDVLVADHGPPCPCGSPFRRIAAIEGRSDDVWLMGWPGGPLMTVYPDFVRRVFLETEGVAEYRAVQTGPGAATAEIDPAPGASLAEVEARLLEASERVFRQALGVPAPNWTVSPWRLAPGATKLRRVSRSWAP